MRTMTLRMLQQPMRLLALLESLVVSQNWIPSGIPQISDWDELSSPLQKLATRIVANDGAWLAWRAYDGVRFFVVEMSLELSRERRRPALKVSYYNDQGALEHYSHWVQLPSGLWQRFVY